jgi:hypothetical protein
VIETHITTPRTFMLPENSEPFPGSLLIKANSICMLADAAKFSYNEYY